ncbi:MAG: hypothetical protein HN370_00910 [Phycisphaerales bacterium]|jgi:hypothetical protein|nr:hypothetical protein [Phycisphaerales bacterium]
MFSLATLRRKQKTIFWIMILLMLSFLIGLQGFQSMMKKDPGAAVLAKMKFGDLTHNDQKTAEHDIALLTSQHLVVVGEARRAVTLADGLPQDYRQTLLFLRYLNNALHGKESVVMAYAVLLAEARANGHITTEGEIDQVIKAMEEAPIAEYDFAKICKEMRLSKQQTTMFHIRGTLGRLITICKSSSGANAQTPPSEQDLRRRFRDEYEKLGLTVIKLPLAKANDAKPVTVKALFDAYKNIQPGDISDANKFPFGYQEPAKAQIASLLVNQEAILAVARAHKDKVANFIASAAEGTFTKPAPVTADETKKEDEKKTAFDVKYVPMTEEEKVLEAQKALSPTVGVVLYKDLLNDVHKELGAIEANAETAVANPYPAVVKALTADATGLLNAKVKLIAIKDATVEVAVAKIESAAGDALSVIAYPTGDLDAKTRITLRAKNTTVGALLADLHKQVQAANKTVPAIAWAKCKSEKFDTILFPADGLPLQCALTPLADAKTLAENPLFGETRLPNGGDDDTPANWAVRAQPVDPKGPCKVGKAAPIVETPEGKLFWRVTQAVGPKSPEAISPALTKQLEADAAVATTFESTKALGKTLATAKDAEAYAKTNKLKLVETGLFSRASSLGAIDDALANDITKELFKADAFAALLPETKALTDGTYPKASTKAITIALPCETAIYLVWRTDYAPALEEDYANQRSRLAREAGQDQAGGMSNWLDWKHIQKRTGFGQE